MKFPQISRWKIIPFVLSVILGVGSLLLFFLAKQIHPIIPSVGMCFGVSMFGLYGLLHGLGFYASPNDDFMLDPETETTCNPSLAKVEALSWIIPGAILFLMFLAFAMLMIVFLVKNA